MDLLSLGKNPINDDQPSGAEVRYEPEFEELQAEIDKLSIPSASGGLDWQKVSDLAAKILAEKSKNLLVASYLAVSQVHLNQIDGLALGLNIIHDLLDRYWENLFPPKKRLRGRIGAIEWWVEKIAAALEGLEVNVIAAEKLAEITSQPGKCRRFSEGEPAGPPTVAPHPTHSLNRSPLKTKKRRHRNRCRSPNRPQSAAAASRAVDPTG